MESYWGGAVRRGLWVCGLLVMAALAARAQDITDVFAIITAARSVSTVLVSLTGTDGTVCTLAKLSTNTISATWRCASADGKQVIKPATISSTSATSGTLALGQGAVLCLIAVNPTASAVTYGSLGSIPASGIGWSCTADSTTIKNGTAVWP